MMYEPPAARSELMLRHMMAGGVRRWVLYEWLYPAIDRPWYMKNELQVSHMTLHTPPQLQQLCCANHLAQTVA